MKLALPVASELSAPNVWPAEAIWQAVAPGLAGFTVEILPSIDSTNTELMRRARAGLVDPVLLVAQLQTAGRGRLGRQWLGAAGSAQALTFSLGLPLRVADWSGLSLAVGLSLVHSLHPALRLKWPNDLYLDGRKLGGILIETLSVANLRYVVIGVGLNIGPRDAAGLSTPAAWLRELAPEVDSAQALLRVVPPLVSAILAFAQHGFAPLRSAYLQRDALAGAEVQLSDGTCGRAAGVDERGALLVQTCAGLRRVDSAEVSVRPVPASSA